MDAEKEAAKTVGIYGELAKQNPNVDATTLMTAALVQAQQDEIAGKKKRWAYLISVGLPPFGLIYAIKYFLNGSRAAKRTAWICVILTVASLLASFLIFELFLSSAGPQLQELQQSQTLDANELKDLLQQ